jgi:hypothetical protein
MIASVHVADVGAPTALALMGKGPKPAEVPGLRNAHVALAAPLGGSVLPAPQFWRIGLIAFWDDDAAVDRFLADHPVAQRLAGGWRVRLTPQRLFGSWPGVDPDLPRSRAVTEEGPVAVLTFGRTRMSQIFRFLRTSNKAENAAIGAPGLTWTTGFAKPPFFATCSLWQSAEAATAYAYGQRDAGHPHAIDLDREKPFHKQQAFIRFRPYRSEGHLVGKNPLHEHWLDNAPRAT